ncbi:DUF3667 domain-containing protein [Mucilaginibacter sp. RS28]|uniref:DUF3667 domain-containing protein n=1 Tax=Mucilaginibacter straminoryzae TaxID=2932774 RepID=A0A9X2BF02_9SPHI|nr:DUF3667 domain-containing protein [Mucilaginibacter straminoryzae]MCJ8211983.1 DUF3667 domain-containing protein [Mucilaginibacter straminoryzae]
MENTASHCLNCGNLVAEKYCGNCGQVSSTHRYSLKHVVTHDFVHGVWHVDKGVLYTLKELFTNPGHSVRAYILGKRANYFNFITLLLLILAMSSLVSHYSHIKLTDLVPESGRNAVSALEEFSMKYPKLVLLITIPITSVFSLLWFKKGKFNYAEHLVLNSYKASAELTVALLFTIITIFYTNISGLIFIYYIAVGGFTFVYSIWFYYQFFSKSDYTKKSLLFRAVMAAASPSLLSLVIGLIVGIATHAGH